MGIYKPEKSPYWHFDFQFKKVRYHGSTNCTSKRDAERYERNERTRAALGVTEKPGISLDEALGIYWNDKGQFESARVTVEYQMGNLNRLIGKTKIFHDITDLDLSAAIARRRGETVKNGDRLISNGSVNREIELLKRVVNHVAGTYKVPEIQWRKLKLTEAQERIREASHAEEEALFEHLDDDMAALVEFGLLSGARKDALVTLLWSKCDLQRGWAEVRKKGGGWHRLPLTARMMKIIRDRPKVGPFVFTYVCERNAPARKDRPRRVKGERYPYSKNGWARKWYAALKAAGIEDFRFHDLRHTTGSRVTRSSNIKAAQILLGHTRIETTTRYAHVHEDDLRKAMENAEKSRNSPDENSNVEFLSKKTGG